MEALFADAAKYIEVIEILHSKKMGLIREDIVDVMSFRDGGSLTKILHDLEVCGFIRKYRAFSNKKRGALYQLTDAFILFYLTFMRNTTMSNYWSSFIDNARHRSWRGYAFEQVCFAHIKEIVAGLGISGIRYDVASWVHRENGQGVQIDLLIDRADRVINICEIKFWNAPFEINKSYDLELRNKIESFRSVSKTKSFAFNHDHNLWHQARKVCGHRSVSSKYG